MCWRLAWQLIIIGYEKQQEKINPQLFSSPNCILKVTKKQLRIEVVPLFNPYASGCGWLFETVFLLKRSTLVHLLEEFLTSSVEWCESDEMARINKSFAFEPTVFRQSVLLNCQGICNRSQFMKTTGRYSDGYLFFHLVALFICSSLYFRLLPWALVYQIIIVWRKTLLSISKFFNFGRCAFLLNYKNLFPQQVDVHRRSCSFCDFIDWTMITKTHARWPSACSTKSLPKGWQYRYGLEPLR